MGLKGSFVNVVSKIWESEVQQANPLSPVKSADERSEESATCPSGMKWSEGVQVPEHQKIYNPFSLLLSYEKES
jgi:hypothetical protein